MADCQNCCKLLVIGLCFQVVDEDLQTGKQVRRFLAYDLMLLMGENYLHQPFEVPLFTQLDATA